MGVESLVAVGLGFDPNANIQALTRVAIIESVRDQIFIKQAVLALLVDRGKISWEGGTKITQPMLVDDLKSLVQRYKPATDNLVGGRKVVYEMVEFDWKWLTLPLVYDANTLVKNRGIDRIADQVERLATLGLESIRKAVGSDIYGDSDESDQTDDQDGIQSLRQALEHDKDYGGLERTDTSDINNWWQGADVDQWASTTKQTTSISASVATIRKMALACAEHAKNGVDLVFLSGADIFLKLKAEVAGRTVHPNPPSMLKFGFVSFWIDEVEIIYDPFISPKNLPIAHAAGTDDLPAKWGIMLNIVDWEFRVSPERNFQLGPFVHQAIQEGGKDHYMARFWLTANLVNWHPNTSMTLLNMS